MRNGDKQWQCCICPSVLSIRADVPRHVSDPFYLTGLSALHVGLSDSSEKIRLVRSASDAVSLFQTLTAHLASGPTALVPFVAPTLVAALTSQVAKLSWVRKERFLHTSAPS